MACEVQAALRLFLANLTPIGKAELIYQIFERDLFSIITLLLQTEIYEIYWSGLDRNLHWKTYLTIRKFLTPWDRNWPQVTVRNKGCRDLTYLSQYLWIYSSINPQAPAAQKVADEVVFRRFQGEGVEFFFRWTSLTSWNFRCVFFCKIPI